MTGNDKITQAVKETLSNYEPSFDASGWNEMEKRLDGIPKAPSFKWTFSLNTVVGTTVLAGGLLAAYLVGGSSSMDPTANTKNNQPEPVQETEQTPVQQIQHEIVAAPAVSEEQAAMNEVIAENPVIGEALKMVEAAEVSSKQKDKKTVARKSKPEEGITKEEADKALSEYDFMKAQESMKGNNVATFGDQISTTQGFVNNTSEDEALRQKAQSKIAIGNEILSSVKKDSTLNSKVIGNGESTKKQSKRKKNKTTPAPETAPANTSTENGETVSPKSN